MSHPVIIFDYDFSPYAQKIRLLLKAAGVSYSKKDEPAVLPRPDLEALGITYRRIPLLSVGKDVYADSHKIIDVIVNTLGRIQQSPADKAYETWGNNLFQELLSIIPLQVLTPEFVKDRATIFPSLGRPDLKTLKPSGMGQFIARVTEFEHDFLGKSSGPFIGGSQLSLADIHAIWPIRWALENLGVKNDPGVGKDKFPKLWKLLESLPNITPDKVLDAAEAQKTVKESRYSAKELGIQSNDPLGLEKGTEVTVESFDSTPGSHPQYGKLVGTDTDEAVIEIDHGIRLHFPRIGYLVRNLQDSPAKQKL